MRACVVEPMESMDAGTRGSRRRILRIFFRRSCVEQTIRTIRTDSQDEARGHPPETYDGTSPWVETPPCAQRVKSLDLENNVSEILHRRDGSLDMGATVLKSPSHTVCLLSLIVPLLPQPWTDFSFSTSRLDNLIATIRNWRHRSDKLKIFVFY